MVQRPLYKERAFIEPLVFKLDHVDRVLLVYKGNLIMHTLAKIK